MTLPNGQPLGAVARHYNGPERRDPRLRKRVVKSSWREPAGTVQISRSKTSDCSEAHAPLLGVRQVLRLWPGTRNEHRRLGRARRARVSPGRASRIPPGRITAGSIHHEI